MYIKKGMYKIKHSKGLWRLVNDSNESIPILVDREDYEENIKDGKKQKGKSKIWTKMEKFFSNKIVKLIDITWGKDSVDKIFAAGGEVIVVDENKLAIKVFDLNEYSYIITFERDKNNHMLFLDTQDVNTLVRIISTYCDACKQEHMCDKCAIRVLGQKVEKLINSPSFKQQNKDKGDDNELVLA